MIVNDHIASYTRLVPWLKPKMLMLGAQRNTSSFRFPCEYQTLDPDGGDYPLDLSNDDFHRPEMALLLERRFETVFDLGTLEHIWDTHAAYVNAARMVAFGGHFLGQAPIAGWENHAIHITDWRYILEFFQINGFNLETWWVTTANGAPIPPVVARNGGKSLLLWYVAKRNRDLGSEPWRKPSQVYSGGVKPPT